MRAPFRFLSRRTVGALLTCGALGLLAGWGSLAAADEIEGGPPDRLPDLLLVAAEAAIMGGDRDGVDEAARRAEPLTPEAGGWGPDWLAGVAMVQAYSQPFAATPSRL